MIVYRFEKNGIGPYMNHQRASVSILGRSGKETRSIRKARRLFDEQLLKGGKEDRLSLRHKAHMKNYLFGCKSKQQLRAYFSGDFKQLFLNGYRIKRYKVPDDDVLDLMVEVAFPVRYHKLRTVEKVNKLLTSSP